MNTTFGLYGCGARVSTADQNTRVCSQSSAPFCQLSSSQSVYYWVATLENDKAITSFDMDFENLPFKSVRYFELRPIQKGCKKFPPVRIFTENKPFQYFCKGHSAGLYYIVELQHKVYIVEWPNGKCSTLKSIEEL